MNWITAGGPYLWIQFLFTFVGVLYAVRQVVLLSRKQIESPMEAAPHNDVVLLCGVLIFSIGLVAPVIGLANMAGAILVATDISPQIVSQGIKIATVPLVYGFWGFFFALLLWMGLRFLQLSKISR